MRNQTLPKPIASEVFIIANNIVHRFHSIEEDLIVPVFFAPAEYSKK
jgi:hypothetical protein